MEVVQAWRNSLKARPPPMKKQDEYYPGKDRRYEDLAEDQIPLTESLMDCMERGKSRTLYASPRRLIPLISYFLHSGRPLWEYAIKKEIERGNTVLVVAHTNTLRGLMKHIDDIDGKEVEYVDVGIL